MPYGIPERIEAYLEDDRIETPAPLTLGDAAFEIDPDKATAAVVSVMSEAMKYDDAYDLFMALKASKTRYADALVEKMCRKFGESI